MSQFRQSIVHDSDGGCFHTLLRERGVASIGVRSSGNLCVDDGHPVIVLTETKFSFRCIPVGIGTLLTGLGLKKKAHVMMLSP